MHPFSVIIPFLLLSTCSGPRSHCASTCDYVLGKNSCSIYDTAVAVSEGNEFYDYCVPQCKAAWHTRGDIGSYNPYEPVEPGTIVVLENRAQVKAWTDCVAQASCDDLYEGYCAPTVFR